MGEPERVVWIVDDEESLRDLFREIADDAGIKVDVMNADELIERRHERLPDGAMLDGSILTGGQADEILAGIPRLVVCTARAYAEIATNWTDHPNVRVILKPMALRAFEDAVRWLAGADDSTSWPTPKPKKRS